MRHGWRRSLLAVGMCLALVAAACGDDNASGGSGGDSPGTTGEAVTPSRTPKSGGTLTVGLFVPMTSFDPVRPVGAGGCCNGNELAALYDTLVSLVPETGEYKPRIAESLEPNDDYTKWTLKLRSGVTFTDGTDFDGDAVKFNIERHTAPTSTSGAKSIITTFVDSIDVVDPLTVEFSLTQGWTGFPALLAREVGMIASPAAIEKAGENFAAAPGNAGAGPFKLVSFKPGESIEMVKNADFYGGDVYLDGLRFVSYGTQEANLEALKTGDLDAMYAGSPDVMAQAEKDAVDGILAGYMPYTSGIIFNSGVEFTCTGGEPAAHCTGKADGTVVAPDFPTSDVRVRRAVAAAVDPSVINQRAYGGTVSNPTTEIFPEPLSWAPGVAGPEFNPEQAKALVEQAKADGWDGKLRLRSSVAWADEALAVETMLRAVGIDVQLDASADSANHSVAVLVRKDFDLAIWSVGFAGDIDTNYTQLLTSFGPSKRYGYNTPAMNGALDELRLATNETERISAMKKVSTVLTEDVPMLSFFLGEEKLLTQPDVHGVVVDSRARVLFDKAWLDR